MSLNLKKLALARDIEQAFKNFLNTDSFPTAEWPAMALAVADVVIATGLIHWDTERTEYTALATELVQKIAKLNAATADLVGL